MHPQDPIKAPEWIGVAEVAAELGITPRKAWGTIKRLKVPCLLTASDPLRDARFRRSAWERARDADLAAVETDHHGHARPAAADDPPPAPTPSGGLDRLLAMSSRRRLKSPPASPPGPRPPTR